MRTLITEVSVVLVNAAEYTNWVFIELGTDAGLTGTGEASLSGQERQVAEEVDRLRPALVGRDVLAGGTTATSGDDRGMLSATIRSALDQAVWDLRAALLGVPLWRLLGGSSPAVPLYANINRASLDRSPRAMAELASQAIASGFQGVKCAPLDGIDRLEPPSSNQSELLAEAIARVAAVRRAIGPEAALMVDCHWRLTPGLARELIDRLEPLNLTWLEDPFPEEAEDDWLSLKEYTDIPLAGGERATALAELARSLTIGQYDICCPDVRHIGGTEALWHASHLIHSMGAAFAPHNPRGPIGTIASAQVSAASPTLMFLEFPFGECAWRSSLVRDGERIENGKLVLADLPGIGAHLDASVATLHPFRQRRAPREESKVDIW